MPDSVAPWLSSEAVSDQLDAPLVDGGLSPSAERARLAAAAWVERRRRDLFVAAVFTPTADVELGALLLAHRLYARKGSPQGLASFGELGVGAVLRLDPDIERLVGVGRHGKPVAI